MGSIEQQLNADMIAAMKAHNRELTSTLRMAIAALKNEKVAGKTARELTEADEIVVLQREVSKRKDSAEAYAQGNRPELASKELSEADVIGGYLPASLSEAEIDAILVEEFASLSAALGEKPGMKNMGQLMKSVQARTAGRAEGGVIAAKVRAALG